MALAIASVASLTEDSGERDGASVIELAKHKRMLSKRFALDVRTTTLTNHGNLVLAARIERHNKNPVQRTKQTVCILKLNKQQIILQN